MGWTDYNGVKEFAPGSGESPASQQLLVDSAVAAELELRDTFVPMYGQTVVDKWLTIADTPEGAILLCKMLGAAIYFQKLKGYERNGKNPTNAASQRQATVEAQLAKYAAGDMQLRDPVTKTPYEVNEGYYYEPTTHMLEHLAPGCSEDDY